MTVVNTQVKRDKKFKKDYLRFLDRNQSYGISKEFDKKIYSVKETGLTYRTINNWDKEGLFSDERDDKSEWRRFSHRDLFWIKIINRLRGFGFPIDKIRTVKQSLLDRQLFISKKEYPTSLFEFYLLRAMSRRIRTFLIVFEDGKSELLFHSQLIVNQRDNLINDYITIYINNMLDEVFRFRDLKPLSNKTNKVDFSQIELLMKLRTQKVDTIELIESEGKIRTITKEQFLDQIDKRINELANNSLSDIHIKTSDNKLISVKDILR